MSLTPSQVAHAAIDQMFRALDGVLEKAAADAEARGIEESVFLNARLAPDMFPLFKQVQIATEFPARTLARLAGEEPAGMSDAADETFSQSRARIVEARRLIKALDEAAMDADPDAPITFPAGPDKEMTLPRRAYLQNMILPNLYFHVSMAYAILRHLGVDIGKMDFLAVPRL